MRLTTLLGAVAILAAAPVFASVENNDQTPVELTSFAELAERHPDLDKALFAKIDTDDDGFVSDAEWDAALEAGLIETDTPAG